MNLKGKLIHVLTVLVLAGANAAESNPAPALSLPALLRSAHGDVITTPRQWSRHREQIRRAWRDVLGELPGRKPPLKTEILNTEHLPGFTRQHVRYQVEADEFTDGYLLTPTDRRGRRPAVVVFHPTTPLHAKGVAGLASEYDRDKWHGLQLVERGYVVWCPRNYINLDGADWAGNARRAMTAHPGWTGMTRMLWDAIRAVDFVQSLPTVDRRRIGVLGHSLGGKQALYAAAFDARVRAAVSSEGGIGLKFSNWDAVWYLGPQIRDPDFALEHHQLLALVAPRAFLLVGGESADGDRSEAFVAAARPVYTLLGAESKLEWFNHRLGHRYPPEARVAAEEFLDRHLKP